MSIEDFDVDQLADFLHLTPSQVARMAARDKLPGRRVGGEWRFPRAEIHHWLEERIGASDEQELVQVEQVFEQQDRKQGEHENAATIESLLNPDAVLVPLQARTRRSVITNLCKHCADLGLIWEPEKMAEAIRQRENLHSTALENGVALLHPRRPMPNIMGEAFLALGKTFQGIPFGGPRGQLTDIFFLIASTDDRIHLRTLARLSRVINNPKTVSMIRESDSGDAIRSLLVEIETEMFPE